MYRGVLISGSRNRGVPKVSSFQGGEIERFHCTHSTLAIKHDT